MQHQNNFSVLRLNYYEFGTKSLPSFGPKIWHSLAVNIKSVETFKVLKKSSKHGTEKCVCAVCAHITRIVKSCKNK